MQKPSRGTIKRQHDDTAVENAYLRWAAEAAALIIDSALTTGQVDPGQIAEFKTAFDKAKIIRRLRHESN